MAYVIKLKRSNNSLVVKHVTRNVTLQHVGRRGPQGIQGIQGPPGSDADALVSSVNGEQGDVVLDTDDISEGTNKYVTSAEKTKLSNLSGVNTGDQDLSGYVPITRTVNGSALSANITLDQDDVLDGATYKQYSQTEKTKLAGIATGATANSSDAYLLARANHTGTQAISTIVNLQSSLDAKEDVANKATSTSLGTSDTLYPSQNAVKSYVDTQISTVEGSDVDSFNGRTGTVIPATDDYTWAQINKATSNIADITTKSHTSLTDIGSNTHSQIDTAITASTSHIASTSNPHSVTKTQVGLGNVDNTSDANKPVSTATQTELDLKATIASLTAHEADTTSVHGITDTSTLYRAGGTNVAIADGGTDSSTASGARTALGVQAKSFVTVGTADADYITDGTADDVQLQAAVDSLPSTGGRIFLKNSTYNVTARINITGKSNVVIEGESRNGVIIKAASSLFVSGVDHQYGIFSVKSHTTPIRNIVFRDMTLDANNQEKTQCLTITGGTTEGVASTTGVVVEGITFKNLGADTSDTARAPFQVISGNTTAGNFGIVNDLTVEDCEFDTGLFYMMYFLGDFITNVKILNCYFHDNRLNTIHYHQYSDAGGGVTRYRSLENWEIGHCRFENTMTLTPSASSRGDIYDANQTGIKNLNVHDCYFGPRANAEPQDHININVHGTWPLIIKDNFFDQVQEAISLGKSLAGSYYKLEPSLYVQIEGNTFYRLQQPIVDGDSNFFTTWANNRFIYCNNQGLSGYSRHWPTVYDGNTFYNCSSDPNDTEEYRKAAIQLVGDGYIVRDNIFIDDRLLSDPSTAPTLSQTAGGSMGARTYYVKYTWANDTGETLASSEATTAISANNLLKVTLPTTNMYPYGAIKINIYVSTSTNTETLQDYIEVSHQAGQGGSTDWNDMFWTEPTTGLVAGAALPDANTTNTLMKYGIYELSGGGGPKLANKYENNHFYGIETPILESVSYTRIRHDNWSNPTITAGGENPLESTKVLDEVYGSGWNSSLEVPTKNAIYDKIETLQPLDSDLTTIAGLTATTDSFIQSKSNAWASRTVAQVKTDLGLTGTNSGDQTSIVGITGTTAQFNTALTDNDFATLAGTEVLTNKAITPRVVSMVDATSITPTGDTADVNTQTNTQAAGTLTANAPSGTPVDEQKLVLRIKSTNAQTWSWNAIYRGSNDVTLPTSTTGSSKTDRLGFVYNSADAKWSLVAKSLGY